MKKISIAAGTLITLLMAVVAGFAQTNSRDDLLKQIEVKRDELAALQKLIVLPSEEDRAAYADFLRQPDTGLSAYCLGRITGTITACAAAALSTLSQFVNTITRGPAISLWSEVS